MVGPTRSTKEPNTDSLSRKCSKESPHPKASSHRRVKSEPRVLHQEREPHGDAHQDDDCVRVKKKVALTRHAGPYQSSLREKAKEQRESISPLRPCQTYDETNQGSKIMISKPVFKKSNAFGKKMDKLHASTKEKKEEVKAHKHSAKSEEKHSATSEDPTFDEAAYKLERCHSTGPVLSGTLQKGEISLARSRSDQHLEKGTDRGKKINRPARVRRTASDVPRTSRAMKSSNPNQKASTRQPRINSSITPVTSCDLMGAFWGSIFPEEKYLLPSHVDAARDSESVFSDVTGFTDLVSNFPALSTMVDHFMGHQTADQTCAVERNLHTTRDAASITATDAASNTATEEKESLFISTSVNSTKVSHSFEITTIPENAVSSPCTLSVSLSDGNTIQNQAASTIPEESSRQGHTSAKLERLSRSTSFDKKVPDKGSIAVPKTVKRSKGDSIEIKTNISSEKEAQFQSNGKIDENYQSLPNLEYPIELSSKTPSFQGSVSSPLSALKKSKSYEQKQRPPRIPSAMKNRKPPTYHPPVPMTRSWSVTSSPSKSLSSHVTFTDAVQESSSFRHKTLSASASFHPSSVAEQREDSDSIIPASKSMDVFHPPALTESFLAPTRSFSFSQDEESSSNSVSLGSISLFSLWGCSNLAMSYDRPSLRRAVTE